MRIGITGSRGFIGTYLKEYFSKHQITPIERSGPLPEASFDAVINLAGASIARRWTPSYKQEIYDSRILGTRRLVESVKTNVLISVSAVGFYGDRGDEELDESSSKGQGFLSDVCEAWEAEAMKSSARVCIPRFGMALGRGGALAKMLPAFRLGLGGRLGDGQQWMSWIAIEDLARGIEYLIEHGDCQGVYNFCAPNPVRNIDFTKMLAQMLHRWVGPPMPAGLLKLIFGEMGEQLFLASTKVFPKRLLESGFVFEQLAENSLKRYI